jgi:hypothetical protein
LVQFPDTCVISQGAATKVEQLESSKPEYSIVIENKSMIFNHFLCNGTIILLAVCAMALSIICAPVLLVTPIESSSNSTILASLLSGLLRNKVNASAQLTEHYW